MRCREEEEGEIFTLNITETKKLSISDINKTKQMQKPPKEHEFTVYVKFN